MTRMLKMHTTYETQVEVEFTVQNFLRKIEDLLGPIRDRGSYLG